MYESAIGHSHSAQQQSDREKMGDTKVETIARLAQWKIDNIGPCSYKKSDSFKIGLWNWFVYFLYFIFILFTQKVQFFLLNYGFVIVLYFRHLAIEKNRLLYIRLFPEPSRVSKDQPPHARFILRVSNLGLGRRPHVSASKSICFSCSFNFVFIYSEVGFCFCCEIFQF